MQSSFFKTLFHRLQLYATGLFPDPPTTKPPYLDEVYTIQTRAWGCQQLGNDVMACLPERAVPVQPTVIIDLHGLRFCNPYFYDAHLQPLAKQGADVFFVDYQIDHFPDTQTPLPPGSDWTTTAQFLAAALESFHTTGQAMITNACKAVQVAMARVFPMNGAPDIFLFGHSVRGLFALRWPFFNGATGSKGSLAADPIPATASLPAWLMDALLRNVRADPLTVAMSPFPPAP
jgi:hypothetical protein